MVLTWATWTWLPKFRQVTPLHHTPFGMGRTKALEGNGRLKNSETQIAFRSPFQHVAVVSQFTSVTVFCWVRIRLSLSWWCVGLSPWSPSSSLPSPPSPYLPMFGFLQEEISMPLILVYSSLISNLVMEFKVFVFSISRQYSETGYLGIISNPIGHFHVYFPETSQGTCDGEALFTPIPSN